jgi:hypothetical protein
LLAEKLSVRIYLKIFTNLFKKQNVANISAERTAYKTAFNRAVIMKKILITAVPAPSAASIMIAHGHSGKSASIIPPWPT